MNVNNVHHEEEQGQKEETIQKESEGVNGSEMEDQPDVSDISTSSLEDDIDRTAHNALPSLGNFDDEEQGTPYGTDEGGFYVLESEDYNIRTVRGADILLRNRSSLLTSGNVATSNASGDCETKSKGSGLWNCDLLENSRKSSRLQGGFRAMYEESLSQASSRLQSRNKYAPRNACRPSSDPSRSDPSRGSSTGQSSPYYERTGAWLRFRPQNPAMIPLNARYMNESNRNPRLLFSSRSSSSGGHGSDVHRGDLRRDSVVFPFSHVSCDGMERIEENVVGVGPVQQGSETVNAVNGEYDYPFETPHPQAQDQITIVDDELLGDEDPLQETLNYATHDGEEVTVPKVPIFHQLSSLPIDVIDTGDDRPKVQHVGNSIVSLNDTQWASPDSKYERYACRVDQNQGDKSVEIPLFVFQRPHMRAFHFAWISFFVAFFTWFAISPLLPEIKASLNLSHREIWMSNIFSSAGTVICRVIVGPLNDRFGARWVMATTLVVSSIPVMATGLVNSSAELSILRLITGIAGSSFVTCQYWTSCMFTREVAGTANSLVAGWGNLGGGVTQIVMGSVLFPLFKLIYKESGKDESDAATRAWRVVCVIPAILSFITAILIIRYSDDSPKGNYKKLRRQGQMYDIEAKNALKAAASNINTWLLAFHYGCCFGAEVTMTAGATLYFSDEFQQKTESAAALASIFGWMNLFARGMGGFVSDIMNAKYGMKGRLYWQFATVIFEGFFLLAFAYANTLGTALCTMIFFSLFVQSSEVSVVGFETIYFTFPHHYCLMAKNVMLLIICSC